MKVNAPEKLYIKNIKHSYSYVPACTDKNREDDIEYTRTDVFIEKAEKFLKSYRRETPDKIGYISGIVDDKMIVDFKNYMKGE